ncbi:MAG: bifunctional tetrahydrofolate synthase/dihydrofolate synthase [Gammaproteobacteria bacterium]|nr:bifunctional tetrahydrofolate synthase/dihydrofolate synthase [Gammaproteobacteria bacterium]
MRFASLSEWLTWQKNSHVRTIDLSLDRVKIVHAGMQIGYKPFTITVSGTNGKGSTVAFLESILSQENYRIGTYTSPHIVDYNERIRISGQPVDDAVICEAFEKIDAIRGDISLSFFEFGTLAALDIFASEAVDIQLLEVGLGGRLDAVNVIDTDLAIVSSIGIDHVHWLGQSREQISLEKAGIMRQGIPAVIGDLDPPQVMLDWASSRQVPVSIANRDYHVQTNHEEWSWHGNEYQYPGLPLPGIPGSHQIQNAAAVIQALSLVKDNLKISRQAITEGIRSASLPGRFQLVESDSVTQQPAVLIDVAHNAQSAQLLAQNIRQHYPDRTLYALFSVMADKDIAEIVMHMKDCVKKWYPVPLQMERAATSAQIYEVLSGQGVHDCSKQLRNFDEAWSVMLDDIHDASCMVLIFGSFFLVSEYFQRFPKHLLAGFSSGTKA